MIRRSLSSATAAAHDLVIVGGGIYGAMVALEASRQGLRPLLVEREDFGGQTTWNSLRILHGGLRYLQSLDLTRFRELVHERRWLMRAFPDLTRPMPFLMPLYARGLRRPTALRLALALNDRLAADRNVGVAAERWLPPSRLLSVAETKTRYPGVRASRLRGGALWYDGFMEDPPRLVMEVLRWVSELGGTCLNYTEARQLVLGDNGIDGLTAFDRLGGNVVELRAPVVINCAGPWSSKVAGAFDRSAGDLFRPSLAFNVLLRVEPRSDSSLALTPPRRGSRTYFLVPWRRMTLAGTYHAPWDGRVESSPEPSERCLAAFLADLNEADPGLNLSLDDVLRVFGGLLPVRRRESTHLATRDIVRDHAATGGPRGLFSVSGTKLTTSRRVARKMLDRVYGPPSTLDDAAESEVRPLSVVPLSLRQFGALERTDPTAAGRYVARLVTEEGATCLDDLIYRRTDWGAELGSVEPLAARISGLLATEGTELKRFPALRDDEPPPRSSS